MEHLDQADVLWEEFRVLHGEASAPAEGDRLAAYHEAVERLPRAQSALCLSGGGIRSAAFCLGVLQGLARRRLLGQFDYLSTVSGGGYIGSWLLAWVRRAGGEAPFATVERALADPAADGTEAAALHWLRRLQRYLSPRAGLLSADLWAAIAGWLRNLLLNWLVFLPAVAGLLLVPRALELSLSAWAGYATGAGSAFGWLLAPAGGSLAPPRWQGWVDAAAAAVAVVPLALAFRARAARPPAGDGDAAFGRRVVLPLLGCGWLAVMVSAVTLADGVTPDGTLRKVWVVVVPAVLVAARLLAGAGRARTVLPEVVALVPAGVLTGWLVWLLLLLRSDAVWGRGTVRDLAAFGVPALLVAFALGQALFTGLICRLALSEDRAAAIDTARDQEWLARAGGALLRTAALWAAAAGLVLYAYRLRDEAVHLLALFGITGSLTLAAAVSKLTGANTALAAARRTFSLDTLVMGGALVCLLMGAFLVSDATDRLLGFFFGLDLQNLSDALIHRLAGHAQLPDARAIGLSVAHEAGRGALQTVGAIAGLLAVAAAMTVVIDVNFFSLHALYRNRLVRTFLGASNPGAPRSPFTGFADDDDLPLSDLRPGDGPYPVLNMALNLTGDPDTAVQDRKAASFIATALCAGGEKVGYLRHDLRFPRRHMTLGTAMAVSGAAVSPNWGYHSSPVVGLLMTLFNLRLGWWFENPRRAGTASLVRRSLHLFWQEALQRAGTEDRYVYLSDGGHFDNLGLYEMLRRRCRLVVAIDASQDEEAALGELGRSLRQAAIDFGVTVEFPHLPFRPRTNPASAGVYAAIGSIAYPEGGRPGKLIYVKPLLLADAPADVRAYAAGDAKFPHDSTLNQFFTESQFESYRALGAHVVTVLTGKAVLHDPMLPLEALAHRVERSLTEGA